MTVLLQVNEIHKAYGAATILDSATASFGDDQKIGVIGRNGAGKSTLCRIITGHESADSGTITRNTALRLSYLEQHDTFKPGENVLAFLMRTTRAEHWECAQMAARFQLKNKILEESVRNLPGGFQTRVKLAAMLLGDPNFLILDEPTNHLDLWARDALERSLREFEGTVLFVSHDRYFVNRVADHILAVDADRVRVIEGNYSTYIHLVRQAEAAGNGKSAPTAPAAKKEKSAAKTPEPVRRKRQFPYRKVEDIEKDIFDREARIEQLHALLADPDTLRDGDRVRQTRSEITQQQEELARLYAHWEEAAEFDR